MSKRDTFYIRIRQSDDPLAAEVFHAMVAVCLCKSVNSMGSYGDVMLMTPSEIREVKK